MHKRIGEVRCTNELCLTNTYLQINLDLILFNSHGVKNNETLHIKGSITYQKNSPNEVSDGSAILIKQNIKHEINKDFIILLNLK